MDALASLALAAILQLTHRHREPIDPDRAERLAGEIAKVVREQRPLASLTREQTVLVVAAVAEHESGFDEAIENCEPSKLGHQDHGNSVGLMQLYRGPSWGNYEKMDICGDSLVQFRLGLKRLRASQVCGWTLDKILNEYAVGHCGVRVAAAQEVLDLYGSLAPLLVRHNVVHE
jgi:hypothetical protein